MDRHTGSNHSTGIGAPSPALKVPRQIWALGFVSLLMDVSSEMIHALLPVYLVTVLSVSFAQVGWIEGIAEATASIVKIFSGAVSDWLGLPKLLAIVGYGLAALVKPIFPLAGGAGGFITARFLDRVGKGIRGAPRDALVASISPPSQLGASIGLRQSLDTVGAFLGPLAAVALMWATSNHYRAVFWAAVLPAFLAVAMLTFGVREQKRAGRPGRFPLRWSEIKTLGPAYWRIVGVAAAFGLARFSEAFLILKAQAVGLPVALAPMVLVVMNVIYAGAAYPVGALSDVVGRRGLLALGFGVLIAADLAMAFAGSLWVAALGVALWGLHMGLTQGLLSALVADTTPEGRRGVAYGVYNLASGVAMLLGSVFAGYLWDASGPQGAFLGGAVLASFALAMLLRRRPT